MQGKLKTIGRLITVEGGEGVGKSIFVRALAAHLAPKLAARGLRLVTTREPGGTPSADLIRGLFAKPAQDDPFFVETEALLVSAARVQHVRRLLRPALSRGDWVLCDRYTDSSRVYQGALGGHDSEQLEALITYATGGLSPDLTLLLDVDPELALARIAASSARNRHETVPRYDDAQLGVHQAMRSAYLALHKRFAERIVLVDATPPAPEVARAGIAVVERRFDELT